MKMIPIKAICSSLALCSLMAIGGCATSSNPNLYVLEQSEAQSLQAGLTSNVSVLVSPVVLPEYLKRTGIVFKSGGSRVVVNEDDRWAGGLEDNVTSVIRANLATYLNTNESFDYNSNFKSRPDVTVRIRIHEFGPIDDSTNVLNASWELDRSGSSQPQLFTERFITSIQREGDENSKKKGFFKKRSASDLTPETKAMSQALDQLSRKISERIAGPSGQGRS